MRGIKDIIAESTELYQQKKDSIQGIGTLEEELYMLSGLDKNDTHALVYFDIDSSNINYVGSACGTVGNDVFSNLNLIAYLKNNAVKYIIGIIYEPDTLNDSIELNSLALPVDEMEGMQFEEMVEELNGSFRYDLSKVSGWSMYESE